jgi:hypothetical protein
MAAKKRRKKAKTAATKPVVHHGSSTPSTGISQGHIPQHHKRRKKAAKKTLGSLGHTSTNGAVKLQLANVIKTLETIKREV